VRTGLGYDKLSPFPDTRVVVEKASDHATTPSVDAVFAGCYSFCMIITMQNFRAVV